MNNARLQALRMEVADLMDDPGPSPGWTAKRIAEHRSDILTILEDRRTDGRPCAS